MNLPLHFGSPQYLPLLLAVPVVILLARRSLSGLDPIRSRIALTLRALLVLALALALAEVEWRRLDDRLMVIFVVDQSHSIPSKQREEALRFVDKAAAELDPARDRALVVVFGKEASIETEVGMGSSGVGGGFDSIITPEHTDMSAALRLAMASFPQGSQKRIVLISDGNQTRGDVTLEVEQARQQGVEISVVPVRYRYRNEVLIEKVAVPSQVRLEEPFAGRVVIRSYGATRATLRLSLDGSLQESREIDLEPGLNVETFQWALDKAGFFSVEATLEAENDTLYQNNEAHGFVHLQGESSVLYVYGLEGPSEQLLDALAHERVETRAIDATGFPFQPTDLQAFDAVILDDVAAADLTDQQHSNIEYAVQHLGVGLLMIGGPDAFGAGGWLDTPVEKALPVEMEIKDKKVLPKGALAVIMHSCEFPQGNTWGIRITQAAIDKLSRRDEVGVLVYDWQDGDKWLFPLQPATNKERLKRICDTMQAGDMPGFDPTMRLALKSLVASDATLRHMIILSDGDPQQPSAGVMRRCVASKITVSTVAIAPHQGPTGPEVALMKKIARKTGGKFYLATDPRQLPQIFVKEATRVSRSLLVEETFQPLVKRHSAVIKGFNQGSFPPLHGYVMTQAGPGTTKERAEIVLATPKGDPLLAHWRYGVGKALAFTSDARGRWGKDWVGWQGYTRFWAQCVRWVSKELDDSPYLVSTSVKGDKASVILDAVDEDGHFVNHLTVVGKARSPSGEVVDLELDQSAPGRYHADFEVDETGTYTVSLLTREAEGGAGESFTTGVVAPYSEEFRRLEANPRLLERVARQTQGQVIDASGGALDLGSLFAHDLEADQAFLEGWPWLLGLAMALFPLDVFVRRVAIDYAKLANRAWVLMVAILPRRQGTRTGEAAGTLGRLMERKTAVRKQHETQLPARPAEVAAPSPDFTSAVEETPAVTGSAAASGDGDAGAKKTSTHAEDEAEEGLHTSRLLQAKRRAMRGQRGQRGRGTEGEGTSSS